MLNRRGRRRVAVAAVTVLAVSLGAAVWAVVSGGGPVTSPARAARASAPRSGATASSTTTPAVERDLPVTEHELPLVDTGRPVVSNGAVLSASRPLPTSVWAPTTSGPFPLVVFVHGFGQGPTTYSRFCSTLAAAGYVVAAPSFPLEDPALGFPLDHGELPQEAADVSFVIATLERESTAERIDPGVVAVAGHSDGADVALMVGYEHGTVDPWVGAVVADAPDAMSGPVVPSSAPLLLVQGTADTVVPYSASQTVFGQVEAPTFYLSLVGADHLPPIQGGTPWTPVLDAAVANFLDATLAGRGPGRAALAGDLASSPLARVQTAR